LRNINNKKKKKKKKKLANLLTGNKKKPRIVIASGSTNRKELDAVGKPFCRFVPSPPSAVVNTTVLTTPATSAAERVLHCPTVREAAGTYRVELLFAPSSDDVSHGRIVPAAASARTVVEFAVPESGTINLVNPSASSTGGTGRVMLRGKGIGRQGLADFECIFTDDAAFAARLATDARKEEGSPPTSAVADVVTRADTWALRAQWISDSMVQCPVPAHAAGTVKLVLLNAGAPKSSNAVDFTYIVADGTSGNITAIHPSTGPTRGGTLIRVMGKGITKSRFGAIFGMGFAARFGGIINAAKPGGSGGGGGSGGSSSGAAMQNFPSVYFCAFTDKLNTSRVVYEQAIPLGLAGLRCVTPPHEPGTVIVTVSRDDLPPTNGLEFTYTGSANDTGASGSGTIKTAYPAQAVITGGTDVIIYGASFGAEVTDVFTCLFGDTPRPATRVSSTTLRCTTPMWKGGAAKIALRVQREGYTPTNSLQFEFIEPPTSGNVEAIVPNTGPMSGGTAVVVRGRYVWLFWGGEVF
jgi:hypothetical protein